MRALKRRSWPLEDDKTSALINIDQEDDSNIVELWIKNLRFMILKCSRFCLLVIFVYFNFTVYTNVLKYIL